MRRAAATMGLSHTIVSRHVRALEDQFGLILLDRKSGQLTEVAKPYHRRISAAIAEISAATDVVRGARDSRLVIRCSPGLALHWLTARLSGFKATHPHLVVELQAVDSEPDFANSEVDGDIRYMRDGLALPEAPDVRWIELTRPPVFPVASPGVAGRCARDIRSAADILQLPMIEERDEAEWRMWIMAQGIPDFYQTPVARYGHAHLALAAARNGQGIALGNPYLLADDLAEHRLVAIVPVERPFVPVALGAYVFRANKRLWSRTDIGRFRRWLVREFANVEVAEHP